MADEPVRKPMFEVVRDEPVEPVRDLTMLKLGLSALSQRAVAAVADLFTLVTVGSAFWVWMHFPEPSINQLIAEAMYGTFVLSINFVVRGK